MEFAGILWYSSFAAVSTFAHFRQDFFAHSPCHVPVAKGNAELGLRLKEFLEVFHPKFDVSARILCRENVRLHPNRSNFSQSQNVILSSEEEPRAPSHPAPNYLAVFVRMCLVTAAKTVGIFIAIKPRNSCQRNKLSRKMRTRKIGAIMNRRGNHEP